MGWGLLLTSLACGTKAGDDPQTPGPSGQTPRRSGTAGLLQRFVEEEVIAHTEGYAEAGQRLALAIMVGSADGVTLTRAGNAQIGQIAADLDQDGARETMLNVNLMAVSPESGPTGPYQFSIGHGAPGMPTLSVGGTMQINAARELKVVGGYGSFESDYVTGYVKEGEAQIGPTREAGSSVAQAGIDVFDPEYAEPLAGRCALEVDTSGGTYRIRVTIPDDPATPLDEAQEFTIP